MNTVTRLEALHAHAVDNLEDTYRPLSPHGEMYWQGYAWGVRQSINVVTRQNRFLVALKVLIKGS